MPWLWVCRKVGSVALQGALHLRLWPCCFTDIKALLLALVSPSTEMVWSGCSQCHSQRVIVTQNGAQMSQAYFPTSDLAR
jgi:hypothetical protein